LNSRQTISARRWKPLGHEGVFFLFLLMTFTLASSPASAQIKSNPSAVNLNATLTSDITITATPGTVNFNLVRNGTATGSVPVSIKTSWTLPLLFGTITEYAFFTSPAAALTDGASDNIPSANVSGSLNGGAYAAFTGASPFSGGSALTLFNQNFFALFSNPGSRTDSLSLQITTTGLNLPAATYTGVLHIQAQAN
jgi:hypothetical protein